VANILLIDDDPDFSEELQRQVREQLKHDVVCLDSAEEGLRYLSENAVDLVLLDNLMPRMSGLEFLTGLKERGLRVPVILMTSAYNDGTVIDAIKGGAFKYVTKPTNYDDLPRVFFSLIRDTLKDHSPAKAGPPKLDEGNDEDDSLIIGRSQAIQDVLERIGQLVCLDESVLILGETGTGKELVANAIHKYSRRSAAPYLAINCAGIPEQLVESELFGHEKGAFNNAVRRIGKFEHCHGGTLFLDEIGDMTLNTQSKILRVLQDQSFERVGGNETIRTDVRIVAATNVDLEAAAAAGRFRRDLYYRFVFTINLPPLRARGDDLPLLVKHYVRRFSREFGKDVQSVAPDAMEALCHFRWPGNIRELQKVLKEALLRATGPVLLGSFLPPLTARDPKALETPDKDAALAGLRCAVQWVWHNEKRDLLPRLQELLEFVLLRYAETQPVESQVDRARRLGIAKNTLRALLKKDRLDEADDGV
jgi:DNA-binding NtrC family response regulator